MKIKQFKTGVGMWLMTVGLLSCASAPANTSLPLFDLTNQIRLDDGLSINRLKQVPIVIVGEHHTNPRHHAVQLAVIKALVKAGVDVAIGMEMFRKDSQAALDRWIAGDLTVEEFLPIYLDNWNYPWQNYRDIFIYARDHGIAIEGLNVSPGITRQVAYHGFASLSTAQKEQIGRIRCDVGPKYKAYIESAFGAHAHGNLNFNHFCEAQLIWDTVMAENALAYLQRNPTKHLVILTGTAHARKMGIPTQIAKRSGPPVAVILPETTPDISPQTISADEADYIYIVK